MREYEYNNGCVLCGGHQIKNLYAHKECWDELDFGEREIVWSLSSRIPDYIPKGQDYKFIYLKIKNEKLIKSCK